MSIFEKATRERVRFSSSKGSLCVEDLWQLSLESLNSIAKDTNKELKATEEEDFIGTKPRTNPTLQLKMDILKRIIEVKLEEKEAKAKRAERNAKLANLKQLANEKSAEAMQGKSLEEINAMIAELEAAD